MQDFAARLDKDARMMPVTLSEHGTVRGWALASKERAGVYLYYYANHTNAATNLTLTLDVPERAQGYWYSPENAAILRRIAAPAGQQSFAVSAFMVDMALLITPDGPPDIDRDGLANDEDPDDDNDGVPKANAVPWDAFPFDSKEWRDTDGDGIGDNADTDKDGDGWSDAEEKKAGTDPLNRLSFPR